MTSFSRSHGTLFRSKLGVKNKTQIADLLRQHIMYPTLSCHRSGSTQKRSISSTSIFMIQHGQNYLIPVGILGRLPVHCTV